MTQRLTAADRAKLAAAWRAVGFVADGMKVGLGTGSTAAWMVRCLARRVREEGLRIEAVATSARTARLAGELGIVVRELDEVGWLDLTIDGADEFDPAFRLIKGGGGALLHEKIVATASDRMIVITDPSKEVPALGAFPLPVEVIPFGWTTTRALIEELVASLGMGGGETSLRLLDAGPFRTDEGNLILDLRLGRITAPEELSQALNQIPGVVENGLFLEICDTIVVGREDGRFEVREKGGDVAHGEVALDEIGNIFAAELPHDL